MDADSAMAAAMSAEAAESESRQEFRSLDQDVHDVIRDFADLRQVNQLKNIHYLFVTDSYFAL